MENIRIVPNLNLFYGKKIDDMEALKNLQKLRDNFKYNNYALVSKLDYANRPRSDYRINRCNLVYNDNKQISKIVWN
jgi:hypothetical protein